MWKNAYWNILCNRDYTGRSISGKTDTLKMIVLKGCRVFHPPKTLLSQMAAFQNNRKRRAK